MKDRNEKTVKQLAEHLFAAPFEHYLSSEEFSRFCKDNDLTDVWKGSLEFSKDNEPELYGRDVIKNAFELFVSHIIHHRQNDFPELFTVILMDITKLIPCALPLELLEKDLLCLGYSGEDIENRFSLLKDRVPSLDRSPDAW